MRIDRLLEVALEHLRRVVAGRRQRCLVHHLGQIGPDHAGGPPRHHVEVDVGGEAHGLRVHAQDRAPPLDRGPIDHHLAIEPSGPHQGRVEDLGPVGGGHDHDAGLGIEAVHLGEELVQRLLALVVRPHGGQTAARLSDRVNLVDEDDAGASGHRLHEQVAHAGGAHTDEHLHEVGAGEREERDLGLAGDGLGEQGLAGAGRADQQDALRDLRAEGRVARRVLEEVDHLEHLADGFVDAGHVREGGVDAVALVVDLGLVASEAQRSSAAGAAHPLLHAPEEVVVEAPDQQEREEAGDQHRPDALLFDLSAELDVLLLELGEEALLVDAREPRGGDDLGGLARLLRLQIRDDPVALDLHLLHLALVEVLQERAVGDDAGLLLLLEQLEAGDHGDGQEQHEYGPERRGARRLLDGHLL